MDIEQFLSHLHNQPNTVSFEDTMAVIDAHYTFSPTAFKNGEIENQANQNNGSCKLFAFAHIHSLSIDETLACFGRYYREDVLKNPTGNDHGNIRNFIKYGWTELAFSRPVLTAKSP